MNQVQPKVYLQTYLEFYFPLIKLDKMAYIYLLIGARLFSCPGFARPEVQVEEYVVFYNWSLPHKTHFMNGSDVNFTCLTGTIQAL